MSLVICIITDTFALMGAEKRGKLKDFANDNANKLIKVNKNILFGCTGGILDNYKLFEDFCYYSQESGLYNIEEQINFSYKDFVSIISQRFSYLQEIHNNENIPRKFNIQSIVCGYNGSCFEIVCFNLTEDDNIPQGIFYGYKSEDCPYKGAVAGDPRHLNVLQDLVYQRQPTNILQYKNIIKDVIDHGILIDDTINNKYCFEKIKLKDVIID